MQKCHLKKLLAGILASLSLWSAIAYAQTFDLKDRKAKPRLFIRVGGGGNTNLVAFNVPANQLGNGTPITDPTSIKIDVIIQAIAGDSLIGVLTVNSVIEPLKNTVSSTTIPFTEISWVSQDGDIPSGAFEEKVDQYIISFKSSQRYLDYHTFSYANTKPVESGTYRGSVTYTWAIL